MRLPAEFVNSKESKIVDAFTGGKTATGKELTVDVFRNAAKFKQDAVSFLIPKVHEWQRRCSLRQY